MFGNKQQEENAKALIGTMLQNAEAMLGVKPDAASVMYFSTNLGQSSKLWEMLGEGGGSLSGFLPQYHQDCVRLMAIVNDLQFRSRQPCAHAIIQYIVYLCSGDLSGKTMCGHPKVQKHE